jgi:hypothetical protein
MGRSFIIDVEDLADDISSIATLQEQLAEMHKEETLRNLLKTGRTSVNKETPLSANKTVKVLFSVRDCSEPDCRTIVPNRKQ